MPVSWAQCPSCGRFSLGSLCDYCGSMLDEHESDLLRRDDDYLDETEGTPDNDQHSD